MNSIDKNDQQQLDYQRIARAIEYIKVNFKKQPSLEEVAEKVHLSPYHFQRLFKEWAGTSPKKFLQYISVEHAKTLLKEHRATLFDTALQTGLSGTGRLHDLFVNIEGMTPAEYKNGGQNLLIHHETVTGKFGRMTVASTEKGICYMAFEDDKANGSEKLQAKFPNATLIKQHRAIHHDALAIFLCDWKELPSIKLHLKGTPFQIKVWETLLKIPFGNLTTYGSIARQIGNNNAARAVGTAIGNNPIAFLIPCHRVIQSTGFIGDYMWGNTRKTVLIGWESAQIEKNL